MFALHGMLDRQVTVHGSAQRSGLTWYLNELGRPPIFWRNHVSFKRHRLRGTPLPVVPSFFTSSAQLFFAPAESQYESGFTAEFGEADSLAGTDRRTRFQ